MEDWYVVNATISVASYNNILKNSISNDHMIAITHVRQDDV